MSNSGKKRPSGGAGGGGGAAASRTKDDNSVAALTKRSLELLQAFDPTAYLLRGGSVTSETATAATTGTMGTSAFRSQRPVVKRRRMLPPRPESAASDSTSSKTAQAATATATARRVSASSKRIESQQVDEEGDPAAGDGYAGNYLHGTRIPPAPYRDVCAKCQQTTEPPECKEDVLLCDGPGCGREYHLGCCVPSLLEIPEGSWLCVDCSPLGATQTLQLYFDKMKELRGRSESRVQNLLGLILRDAEQVNVPKNEIPLSELERANVHHATALQGPPAQPSSSSSSSLSTPAPADDRHHDDHDDSEPAPLHRLGRDFFLGKPLRLYDDLHDHFHSGRIVDYRRTNEDGIHDFEYLVRFMAGSDERKASASYWIALEEHNVSIGTTLVQLKTRKPVAVPTDALSPGEGTGSPPASGATPTKKRRGRPPTTVAWVPAMVWLRSTRALLSLYGINPDFNIFTAATAASAPSDPNDPAQHSPVPAAAAAKGKSPASASKAKQKNAAAHKRQLWAAVCPFGSKEILECDLVSQTADFAAAVDPPGPTAGDGGKGGGEASHHEDDRVRFLNWLAMAESQAQERVRQWRALPLRNQRHDRALTYRDEAALGPLVPVNYGEGEGEAGRDVSVDSSAGARRHAKLCPLVSPGLDRTRLLQIAMRHHPGGLDLTKDVASTLACRIVSLSDMETT